MSVFPKFQRAGMLLSMLALLLVAMPLAAQSDEADSMAGSEVSDAEVEAFAAALVDVQEIGQGWTQRMQEAESQEDIAAMREEARDEMTAAIEEHGLSIEDYNGIATAAQNDPELAQRIQQAAGF